MLASVKRLVKGFDMEKATSKFMDGTGDRAPLVLVGDQAADNVKAPINRVYLSTGQNKPNKQGSQINPNKQTINRNKPDS